MWQYWTSVSNHADNYYNLMIWAACSTAYFGLLRVCKFTASSPKHNTSFTNLFLSDITIDSHVAPQVANQNHFETVKDRSIQTGYTHLLRQNRSSSLPSKGTNPLPRQTWKQTWPIFILPTNWSLTRATFREACNAIFQNLKLHPHNFNTHSFIIGAAISAKQAGISDSHKSLGKWRSNAYLKYVRVSPQDLSKSSKHLVISPTPCC